MKELRREIMEDYAISPEIVSDCAAEIDEHCDKGENHHGKTLHCLMGLARTDAKPIKKGELGPPKLSTLCRRAVCHLINIVFLKY
jgi:hypothetical protein